jgi:hypothetical protein
MKLIVYNLRFKSDLLNDIENEHDSTCYKIMKVASSNTDERGAIRFQSLPVIVAREINTLK